MGRYDLYRRKKPIGKIVFWLGALGVGIGAWFYWNTMHSDRSVIDATLESGSETVELTIPELMPATVAGAEQADHDSEIIVERLDADDPIKEIDSALPALAQSDAYVAEKVAALSPGLLAWLDTPNVIRKVVLIVNDFSQGQRLPRHMKPFRLNEPFEAERDERGLYLPERSYRRYDVLVEAIDAADVQEMIDFYRLVKPLCDEIFVEFGYPESDRFDDLIKKAAAEILSAPIVETRIGLVKPSVSYRFADRHLEELGPVQKQMLRMGPQNTRILQNKLRLLLEALVDKQESP
ncbi:MAG: DUF3014 domain-containing protein [Methylomicrobium sp.]